MSRTISPSRHIEQGTPELQEKQQVVLEDMDFKSIIQRARVIDQSRLDNLLLQDRISIEQFSAGEEYLCLLGRSGAFPQSPGLEKGPTISGREIEGRIIGRIMLISRPRHLVRKLCGDQALLLVDAAVMSNAKIHSGLWPLLRSALDVLAVHFGITQRKR